MGASFAVGVATAATRVLTQGIDQQRSVSVCHQIDNVRLAGPRPEVQAAAAELMERCRRLGVTVNTDASNNYGVVNDFMGDVVDFGDKTVKCREKHVRRLEQWVSRTGTVYR